MVYGTEFDSPLHISVPTCDWAKNVVVFGEDNRSLVHIYNKKNYIFFLGKGTTQELDNTTIGTKAEHSINFSITERSIFFKFCFKMEKTVFYLSIPQKIYQLQSKNLQKTHISCF